MSGLVNIEFGKTVAKLRKQIGISQEELAFRCGVHRRKISDFEYNRKNSGRIGS